MISEAHASLIDGKRLTRSPGIVHHLACPVGIKVQITVTVDVVHQIRVITKTEIGIHAIRKLEPLKTDVVARVHTDALKLPMGVAIVVQLIEPVIVQIRQCRTAAIGITTE